jgi:hypothetical protein
MYLQRLVRLAAWLSGRRPPPSERSPLDAWLRDWRPPSSEAPPDPYAAIREPHRRKPGGRNSAVALMEPDPPESVSAIGRLRLQHRRAVSGDD